MLFSERTWLGPLMVPIFGCLVVMVTETIPVLLFPFPLSFFIYYFYLFFKDASGYLSDLWRFDTTTETWQFIMGSDEVNQSNFACMWLTKYLLNN
jgi:hypothetical protein